MYLIRCMLVKSCERSYGKSYLECGALFTVKLSGTLASELTSALYVSRLTASSFVDRNTYIIINNIIIFIYLPTITIVNRILCGARLYCTFNE